MKQGESDVKAESVVVGVADFPIYETIDELLNDPAHGMSEPQLLSIVNSQVKTLAMNTLRTAKTKGPTKAWLQSEATNEVFEMLADNPELQTKIRGNRAMLDKLIDDQQGVIADRMKTTGGEIPTE